MILVEGNGRSGVRLVREGREKNGREGGCKGRSSQLRRCEGSGRSGREEACRAEGVDHNHDAMTKLERGVKRWIGRARLLSILDIGHGCV